MYKQLEEFLKKCIEMWWKPRGEDWYYFKNNACNREWWVWLGNGDWYSFHDLFSVDSGLMEFVIFAYLQYDALGKIWFNSNKRYFEYLTDVYDVRETSDACYHYMMMWPMTKEEKIKYFLDNALLPKQD